MKIGDVLLDPAIQEKREEGLNEVDIEERIIEEQGEDSSEEELLEKSIIFQKPEINIRFRNKFTDADLISSRLQFNILEVR